MKSYIITSSEGKTYNQHAREVDNAQVLGYAQGSTPAAAFEDFIKDNRELAAGFDRDLLEITEVAGMTCRVDPEGIRHEVVTRWKPQFQPGGVNANGPALYTALKNLVDTLELDQNEMGNHALDCDMNPHTCAYCAAKEALRELAAPNEGMREALRVVVRINADLPADWDMVRQQREIETMLRGLPGIVKVKTMSFMGEGETYGNK